MTTYMMYDELDSKQAEGLALQYASNLPTRHGISVCVVMASGPPAKDLGDSCFAIFGEALVWADLSRRCNSL